MPESPPAATPPATPSATPKQSERSDINKQALTSWMDGLKAASTETPSAQPASDAPPSDASHKEDKGASTQPPAEAAPTTAQEPPADKWPRSSKDWQAFIKVRDENYKKRDERIKELESKLTETEKRLNGLPTDATTFETVKQERERYEKEAKELNERLRLVAIEQHPKFKAYYDGKINAQVELAKRVVGPEAASAVAEALALPEGQWRTQRIEEISSNLSPLAASRLGSVLNSIEEINAERKGEIDRAKTDFEAAQAKARAEADAHKNQTMSEANARFEAIVKQAGDPKEGIVLFQTREGDKEWNDAVKSRIESARATIFGGGNTSPDNLIRKALLAEAFPALLQSYEAVLKREEALKEQVSKLNAASPSVQTRTPTNGTTPSREELKPGSRPMDVAKNWMAGLREAMGR